jgi:hypothetical protein
MTALIDLTGQRFGRLSVQSRDPEKSRRVRWLCLCDCGATSSIAGYKLVAGISKSCGCLQKELMAARSLTHGATTRDDRWPEWGIWRAMINRCYRPKTKSYPNYGGRGISVCDRWRFGDGSKTGFECFIEDVGRRPSPDLSLDRYPDNDGNYEPGNFRWATSSEQQLNSRSAVVLEFGGKRLSMQDWADSTGIPYKALSSRLSRGWTVERALTQTPRGATL